MAKLENKKTFSGLIGNVVFKTFNGKQIVVSRATHVKQTLATKSSASEFGHCSRWSKQLRLGLTPFLVSMTDYAMYQRFTAAIYNSINNNTNLPKGQRTPLNTSLEPLQGFEFNTLSPFVTYFKPIILAQLASTNEITITIPAFDPKTEMQFPTGCTTAELVLYIVGTNFNDAATPLNYHTIIAIDKNTVIPAETHWNTIPLPENYFVLVCAKLLFYNPNQLTQRNYLNSKSLSPAMVILAQHTGS